MTISPEHCRAARALLDWTLDDLAAASGVAKKTIVDFERGNRTPYPRTLRDIQEAFEAAGVVFTNGDEPGVKLRRLQAAAGNGEHQPAPAPTSPRPRGRKADDAGAVAAA